MRERRFKRSRKPHKVFLVVCEGETEEEYVNMLKRHYRLPIAIRTKVSGNTICIRLVNQYLKELDLEKDDDCTVFYIYDADIECIAGKLLKMPGKAILSNPSIELWYMLHSKDFRRFLPSESVVRELSGCDTVWKQYVKGKLTGEQQYFLLSRQKDAFRRAKNLKWPSNPSSNMHEFLQALEAEIVRN
ncbi:MAG: RloB family protein [Muribaculaceae bacterium]|nr:RloB family protein [Muribaculaceae bacterium]